MQTLNVTRGYVVLSAAAGPLALPAGAVSKTEPVSTVTYRVTFSGSGGGRDLSVTRWLSEYDCEDTLT